MAERLDTPRDRRFRLPRVNLQSEAVSRVAEGIARFTGTAQFLVWLSVFVILWLAWNTFGLTREDLAAKLTDAGLVVQAGGAWESFAHRVDSSIRRDLIVAVNP